MFWWERSLLNLFIKITESISRFHRGNRRETRSFYELIIRGYLPMVLSLGKTNLAIGVFSVTTGQTAGIIGCRLLITQAIKPVSILLSLPPSTTVWSRTAPGSK